MDSTRYIMVGVRSVSSQGRISKTSELSLRDGSADLVTNPLRGLGRNDPCWCGSGKKFKHCHYGRADESPLDPWLQEKQLKKSFSTKQCLAPDILKSTCEGKIVSAHTVPVGSSLRYIAERGHVLGYKLSFADLNKTGGLVRAQKIGLRQASTFYGFCEHHDKSIFSCVENQPFVAAPQQCLTLAFRIMAKEYYTKRSAQILPDLLAGADRGKTLDAQFALQGFIKAHSRGLEAGMRDATDTYDKLAGALSADKYEIISSVVFEFDGVFPVMFAGAYMPTIDLKGEVLQDLSDIDLEAQPVFATALGTENGSAIAVSWLQRRNAVGRLISEQLEATKIEELPSLLLQMAVQSLENCYFSPSWYNGLSENARRQLSALTMDGVNPFFKKGQVKFDLELELNLPTVSSIRRIG